MRNRPLITVATVMMAAPIAAADISHFFTFEHLYDRGSIYQDGHLLGDHSDDFLFYHQDPPPPFDETVHGERSVTGVGEFELDASQVFVFDRTSIRIEGATSLSAGVIGDQGLISVGAHVGSFCEPRFSVSEAMTFDLVASIAWDDPDEIGGAAVKLTGHDIPEYSIASSGGGGTDVISARVTLSPGGIYYLSTAVWGGDSLIGFGTSASFAGEFSVTLTPVPAPAGLAVLAGGLFVRRRRRA